MKIQLLDFGYVDQVDSWGSDQAIIEAARMSTDKGFLGWGTKEKPGDEKLLKYLYEHKHMTPFEMAGMTIEVQAPIFVFREWHRHRTQSYNEMSGRYVEIPNLTYLPSTERLMHTSTGTHQATPKDGAPKLTVEGAENFRHALRETYVAQQSLYEEALRGGIPKELARIHLPVARYSRMRASANLRNWLGFLTLRTPSDAMAEIRQYAYAVSDLVKQNFPRVYDLYIGNA